MSWGIAKTKLFDPAECLDDSESIAAYVSDVLERGDPAFIADALGVVTRAGGMSQVAREAGVSRESIYRALSADGNPEFAPCCESCKHWGCNSLLFQYNAEISLNLPDHLNLPGQLTSPPRVVISFSSPGTKGQIQPHGSPTEQENP